MALHRTLRAAARLARQARLSSSLSSTSRPAAPQAAAAPKRAQHSAAASISAVDARFTTALDNLVAPASGPIVPEFWTGAPAIPDSEYVIDCSSFQADLKQPELPTGLVSQVLETYNRVGTVLLTNTGLESDLSAMRRLGVLNMADPMKYEGGANSRGEIVQNVFDTGAPAAAHLHYHHEMAYVGESTMSLSFCCSKATPGKGATFLSDNVAVTDDLMTSKLGQKLKEKGICYVRCLTNREATSSNDGGVYNHWQQSFGVDDPDAAEQIARSKGLEVEWGPGLYMKTKFYVSAFEYFPQLDRNLLYSSVADDGMWFDTWPGVAELPDLPDFASATPAQRPLKLVFGDDTPLTRDELYQFVNVYDRYGLPVEWKQGDVLLFCNHRFAHGRPEYQLNPGEERTIGVVLGDMFSRVGDLPGKW